MVQQMTTRDRRDEALVVVAMGATATAVDRHDSVPLIIHQVPPLPTASISDDDVRG